MGHPEMNRLGEHGPSASTGTSANEEMTLGETEPVPDGGTQVGAVLLAAGESRRFGDANKLLTRIDEVPIVRQAAATLCAARTAEVVVIVGHDAGAIRECLGELPVSIRTNPAYTDGQSTSVREGVREARERGWRGVIFALGDMPFVSPESVEMLIDRYTEHSGSIFVSAYEGKHGNPVLFDRTQYTKLENVTGDVGGRRLIRDHPESVLVETGDPGVLRDIDQRSDLSGEKRQD